MVRYKRRRYSRRRRSTNVIRMKFQSFMDISTSASSMQVITVSAGGVDIYKRLMPQFGAYKYYKIGNISVKLVPASTLPVDPTGLSYTAGDQLVDPRDQLTPGMMRITNGEDVFENITGLSDAQQHGIYNNMLLDPRWYKWMLQSGVKRHATPRYWQIGQLHQDKWPGAITNYPVIEQDSGSWKVDGTYNVPSYVDETGTATMVNTIAAGSNPRGLFQTGHRGVLGWLPTDGLARIGSNLDQPLMASPPEVEVMKIILPKAYKTVYYYRMFITETVYFKEPIVNFGVVSSDYNMYRPLDIFHSTNGNFAVLPSQGHGDPGDMDPLTGGNYGDD